MSTHLSVPETALQQLLKALNSSTVEEALQCAIETSKSSHGRAELGSKNMVYIVLQLCRAINYSTDSKLLLLCLKLLRNLCAGEVHNQNLFLEQNGIETVSYVITCSELHPDFHHQVICMGLQLLGNVALAGKMHKRAIWCEFFSLKFSKIAEFHSWVVCDPLCMVIHTCACDSDDLIVELWSDPGLPLIIGIVSTVSKAGFREDWVRLLLSRVFLDGLIFESLFSKLDPVNTVENGGNINLKVDDFVMEQSFLLSILSEILNDQMNDIPVSNEFALFVLTILRRAIELVDFLSGGKSGLPTGDDTIDVIGYSLTILRDICASDGIARSKQGGRSDVVDVLVSSGLIEFLLSLLNDLEPPSILKRAIKRDEAGGETSLKKKCPYKGFRRDIVGILGNCAYRRKEVQDDIREKGGILLLLQQCVTDEDNPFLREWGILSVRNVMEGNAANQQLVADLKLQGTADTLPEFARLGLQVEIDPNTHRPKLVNV